MYTSLATSIKTEIEIDNRSVDEIFNKLDSNLRNHGHRVAELSVALSRELDEDINEVELYKSALYHDIGKVMIPAHIVNKPDKLTSDEMKIMKSHAKYSAQILSNCNESEKVIIPVMLHHENYDGSGYPFKYKGKRITINARIIRIADSYVALNSKRSYKEAFIIDRCIEILKRDSRMYDPVLLKIFIEKVI